MYLIDAHSLIFQVFHAIAEMSSPKGLPTNALFGFTRDLLHLRDKNPEYLLAVFDMDGKTFRDDLYAEYKANRGPMPDDLQPQIPLIHQLLEAMRIPILGKKGYEADDVIATVAKAAAQRGLDVFICSSDKDCRQLIDDHVRIYNLRKNVILDRDALKADWEITPEQVVDLQTLVGDPVDNVPGVPGIGLKTAAKLLQEFGTLDNLLANIDRVPGAKKQESLRASGDKIQLSRQLVRLDTAVPMELDWEGWKLRDWDAPKLLALFQEWGFHRFADQMRGQARTTLRQGELFPGDDAAPTTNGAPASTVPPGPKWESEYHLVNTPAKFEAFLKKLAKQKRFAIDLETTGLEPRQADIVGYAVCWKPGEAYYLAVRGPAGEKLLDPAMTLERLRPVLENAKVAKINQNIKYDLIALRQQGVTVAGVAGDPMVADYLLHSGERSHGMDSMAQRYLNHLVIPITDLIGKGKKQLRMDQVPTARVAEYSGEDADVAYRLCDILEPELDQQGMKKLYEELEVPLVEVLAELEYNGIRLDVPRLERMSREMAKQLEEIEQEIYKLAGREFNIASLPQLRQVLFDELKLTPKRKTKITGAASTDQESLELLAAEGHALPRKIVEHRQIAKLKGTYVDALPLLLNPATGRVHASFNQTVAATGRLSSSDPNLQNIPIRSEQGGHIRQAFVPEPGWQLLTADYSQVELRLLAHFTGDAELQRAFAEDRDVHGLVAAQIYGVPEKDVQPAMRRVAKTVNFGVIYGMSSHGLAARLGIPREEAARFIDAYFARYPKVQEYQAKLLEDARRTGHVGTILGRRREFAPANIRPDSTYRQRSQTEREAINMEIQGSAADLMKQAMVNVYRRLRREDRQARMLLSVHDELVFEVPPDELNAVATLVNEEMTTALPLSVPLKVDLSVGTNWLDVEDYRP